VRRVLRGTKEFSIRTNRFKGRAAGEREDMNEEEVDWTMATGMQSEAERFTRLAVRSKGCGEWGVGTAEGRMWNNECEVWHGLTKDVEIGKVDGGCWREDWRKSIYECESAEDARVRMIEVESSLFRYFIFRNKKCEVMIISLYIHVMFTQGQSDNKV
jgi:hypothetical protein